jgi:integrase
MASAAAIPEMVIRPGPDGQGPHIVERPPRSKNGRWMLYIRDGKKEKSTGLSVERRADAETMCDLYKLQKGARERGIIAPQNTPVVMALQHLFDADAPLKRDEGHDEYERYRYERNEYLKMVTRLASLSRFFGGMTFRDVTKATCKAYVAWRMTIPDARYNEDGEDRPNAGEATARVDLTVLRKASRLYKDELALTWAPDVWVPKMGKARQRWMRRREVARMLWAARGRIWDHATGDWLTETLTDAYGRTITRRVIRPPEVIRRRRALGRFVIVGLYSGSRNTAIRELRWTLDPDHGFLDVDRGYIHRLGFGRDPMEGKPRASSRMAVRLRHHAARWRANDAVTGCLHVVHQPDGSPYTSSPIWLWRDVAADAGLDEAVVPHTLRHTAATWLRIAGVKLPQAADFLGMSMQTMARVYGHWALDTPEDASDAISYARAVKGAPLDVVALERRSAPPRSLPLLPPPGASSEMRVRPSVRQRNCELAGTRRSHAVGLLARPGPPLPKVAAGTVRD